MYPDFAQVLTNLRLGLVGDGIIPFKNNAIKHSTWVLLITIDNLPPWLLTKKFFISLVMLIPGMKSPTADNIDVFMQPLVRDLLKLWTGILVVNMSKPEGERGFTLRGMLICTVWFPYLWAFVRITCAWLPRESIVRSKDLCRACVAFEQNDILGR